MFTSLQFILLALLGGLTNRIRGGLFNLPLTFGRIIHSVPFGVVMGALLNGWLSGVLAAIGLFLGLLNGWGSFMDMGRNTIQYNKDNPPICWIVGKEDNTKPFYKRWRRDFIGMSLRGVWLYLPISLLLKLNTHIPLWTCLLGLAMSVFYEIDAQMNDRGLSEFTREWRKLIGSEFFFGTYTYGVWFILGTVYG